MPKSQQQKDGKDADGDAATAEANNEAAKKFKEVKRTPTAAETDAAAVTASTKADKLAVQQAQPTPPTLESFLEDVTEHAELAPVGARLFRHLIR